MTEQETINRRLHELMGLCYHEPDGERQRDATWKCKHCDESFHIFTLCKPNIDLATSWQGFGLLWEWLRRQENEDTWKDFWSIQFGLGHHYNSVSWMLDYISPLVFAQAVVEFFEEAK